MELEYFRIILRLRMCSDPWPLSGQELEDFDYFLNQKARDFGFQDWIDAYHRAT